MKSTSLSLIVLLALVVLPVGLSAQELAVTRDLTRSTYLVGTSIDVSLTADPPFADTTVTETVPDNFTITADGGGVVSGNEIVFTLPMAEGGPGGADLTAERGGTSANNVPVVVPNGLVDGAPCFNDRTHAYSEVAGTIVEGATYVQVANNDKTVADYSLDVTASEDTAIYLLIDWRVGDNDNSAGPDLSVIMNWVLAAGFFDTGVSISIDENANGSIDQRWQIYEGELEAEEPLTLFEQNDGGGRNMYAVAIPGGGALPTRVTYTIEAAECVEGPVSISGTVAPAGGTEGVVAGPSDLDCIEVACDAEPDDASLEAAFAFGSRDLVCPTYNDPGVNYTMVHHAADTIDAHNALAYDEARGWGFEILDEGNPNLNGAAQFGPFDNSPNNRNRFSDTCPEELFDSFIGFKDHPQICDEFAVGDRENPCELGLELPDFSEYIPSGGIFRVDVPNGSYRFVAAVGESDNPHSSRLLAENGGTGGLEQVIDDYVVLVNNHDQNQWDIGQANPTCLGCGVFARVGFNCRIPPFGDGIGADPVFVNMDDEGLPAGAGDDGVYGTSDDLAPESPTLEVTDGYIRFHLLQGNANVGPGSKDSGATIDRNGADIVLLEIWAVEDAPPEGVRFVRADANSDGTANISDAQFILNFLFLGGPALACNIAGDANSDGTTNISDAQYILNFLFLGGPGIAAPNSCAQEPHATPEQCGSSPACAN